MFRIKRKEPEAPVEEKSTEICAVCKGTGTIRQIDSECPYCNGTGEGTKLAETYMQNHTCQCVFHDRKNCPLCDKKCHHNSHQTPRMLIGGGHE